MKAVVFDFDGLIVDTETSIYERALEAFGHFGHTFTVADWATIIGLGDGRWFDALCARLEIVLTRDEFDLVYRPIPKAGRDSWPALPGVPELLDALRAEGIVCGVASSSSTGWLTEHLSRLGLIDHFGVLAGKDTVNGVSKPAPDAYLHACRTLGVDPADAVAIEDSAHGAHAAVAAGMVTVAVPSWITRANDFGHVDLVVDSVVDLDVARLRELWSARRMTTI